jgi:hypothetical protein
LPFYEKESIRRYRLKGNRMSKYVVTFIGLMVMITVPEDSSLLHLAVQGFIGLAIFAVGAINIITEESN